MEKIMVPAFVDYFLNDWREYDETAAEVLAECLSPIGMSNNHVRLEMKRKLQNWLEEEEGRIILLAQAIIHGYEIEKTTDI